MNISKYESALEAYKKKFKIVDNNLIKGRFYISYLPPGNYPFRLLVDGESVDSFSSEYDAITSVYFIENEVEND